MEIEEVDRLADRVGVQVTDSAEVLAGDLNDRHAERDGQPDVPPGGRLADDQAVGLGPGWV